MSIDLTRLVVRHRHVAPMLSVLLGGTNAAVRIRAADETVILERGADAIGTDRFPIVVEGETVGWVEGDRVARSVAAVLAYAAAREADKRSLANEALERYRELSLVYDLAEALSGLTSVPAIGQAAVAEVNRVAGGGTPFLLAATDEPDRFRTPEGVPAGPIVEARLQSGIVGSVLTTTAEPEIVNEPAGDARASATERRLGAIIVAPLRSRGHVVGVVGAATDEPHEYRAGDLKVLAAIAALAGPALDQALRREGSEISSASSGAPAGVG
jgi:GAF domain-containing protein